MTKKSLRLSVGAIFTKGPGKIYFYRYQLDGHRKTVSLQTTNRTEAIKKAEAAGKGILWKFRQVFGFRAGGVRKQSGLS